MGQTQDEHISLLFVYYMCVCLLYVCLPSNLAWNGYVAKKAGVGPPVLQGCTESPLRSQAVGHMVISQPQSLEMCNFYRKWPESKHLPKCTSCPKVLMVLLALREPNESCPAMPVTCVLLTLHGLTFDPKSVPSGQRLVTLELYFHFTFHSKVSLHTCGLWQGNSSQAAEGKSCGCGV